MCRGGRVEARPFNKGRRKEGEEGVNKGKVLGQPTERIAGGVKKVDERR